MFKQNTSNSRLKFKQRKSNLKLYFSMPLLFHKKVFLANKHSRAPTNSIIRCKTLQSKDLIFKNLKETSTRIATSNWGTMARSNHNHSDKFSHKRIKGHRNWDTKNQTKLKGQTSIFPYHKIQMPQMDTNIK